MTIEKRKIRLFLLELLVHQLIRYLMLIQSGNYLNNGFILKTHLSQFMILMLRKEETLLCYSSSSDDKLYYCWISASGCTILYRVFRLFCYVKRGKDTSMPGMHITLNFEEVKGKTTVTSTSTFPTESAAQQAIDMGVETGMNSTLNQLEKLLNQKWYKPRSYT